MPTTVSRSNLSRGISAVMKSFHNYSVKIENKIRAHYKGLQFIGLKLKIDKLTIINLHAATNKHIKSP